MAVFGPGGSIAAAKANEKNKTPSGKSLGTGTDAIVGGGAQAQSKAYGPGASLAAAQTPAGKAVDAAVRAGYTTKSTGSSGGNTPTIERVGTPTQLPPDWSPTSSPVDTTDNTGRLKTQGMTSYVPHPSLGQIVGAVTMLGSPLSAITGPVDAALNGGKFTGGPFGRILDGMRGVEPGEAVGYVGNRVASSTNSRGGARATDDTRLFDRVSAAAGDELVGGATGDVATGGDDGGAEFSSVRLADRRRPYDDLAAVDLLRGLL